jgi:UPF0755 protein
VTIFLLLVIAAIGFYFGMTYVISQNERFDQLDATFKNQSAESALLIDKNTKGAIEVYIPHAADTATIASILQKRKVIHNPIAFIILSKFNGFDGAYLAGTHYVTASMSYDEIMYILTQKPIAVRVTFPEGLTYREVKQRLKDAGVSFDEDRLDSLMRNPQLFLDYPFVAAINARPGRDWLLQGYLYPDTYEFDMNTDEETIILTFLNNAQSKIPQQYYDQARKRGMTLDEAITLASIVQIETTLPEEMRTIAGVFVNRLEKGMPLGTDATINYLRKENGQDPKLWLTQTDIDQFDSPYNSYTNTGLPPGPICSPGDLAIRAALWPESHKYYYFVARGDGSGSSDFSQKLEEHNAKVAKYQAQAQQASSQPNSTTGG